MNVRAVRMTALVTLAALVPPMAHAFAQAPGYAEITSPASGQAVQGLIPIEGSADHPSFVRYDLAFAEDPNPTDTWFPIGDPVATRARQATLALWDTSDITPGVYRLRLRVFLEGGAVLEDSVGGLRLGLPAAAPVSTGAVPTGTATSTPAPTATLLPPPGLTAEPGDPVVAALGIGGLMAAALLLLLAAYLPLRRGLALWAGNLRMRRVLRQDSRRRQGDRSGR